MSNLDEAIREAIASFMRDNYGVDVAEVTSWEDCTLSDGYCETCYYEYAGLKVTYVDSTGKSHNWEYSASFADLVSQL